MAKKRKAESSTDGRASSSKKQTVPFSSSSSSSPSLLLSLPDAILRIILSFSFPKASRWDADENCSQWEWVGILSPTCKQIRHIVQELAPKTFDSSELYFWSGRGTVSQITITGVDCENPWTRTKMWQDTVPGLLRSFQEHPWKGERLRELHIDNTCFDLNMNILESYGGFTEPIPSTVAALRSILTTEGVLPNLEWLDICAPMDTDDKYYTFCPLMDAKTLLSMSMCLPKVTKVCLVGVFPMFEELSPFQFRKFLRGWQSTLEQLTLGQVRWMTSNHVRVLAQQVGSHLTVLELLDCNQVDRPYDIHRLDSRSMHHIAENCHSLESFSLTSLLVAQNIESVFRNNTGSLRQVNISCTASLDKETIMGLLCDLPNLCTLRAHFCAWFDNEVLRAICQTQKQRKLDGVGEFCLNTLGTVQCPLTFSALREFLRENATARLEMGRTRQEVRSNQWRRLAEDFPNATFAPVPEESAFGSTFSPSLRGEEVSFRLW